mgnify:CR=1 FL=1
MGPTTACALLAYLPELGQVGRKAIACLAGVAPLAWESGRRWSRGRIWGGRARAREALYMATLVAVRHNPWLRERYQRLLAAGKPKKVAMVACMRKLLVLPGSMLREGTTWQQQPAVVIHA